MNGDHECPNRNWQGSLENSHISALKAEGENIKCLDTVKHQLSILH